MSLFQQFAQKKGDLIQDYTAGDVFAPTVSVSSFFFALLREPNRLSRHCLLPFSLSELAKVEKTNKNGDRVNYRTNTI